MIKEFSDWFLSKQAEIEYVGELLSEELSKEPEELYAQSTKAESWGSRIGELLAYAEADLNRAKLFYMPEGNDTPTKMKIIIDAKVADIKRARDILVTRMNCLHGRVSLAQSLLGYLRQKEVKGPMPYRSILPRDSTFE